MIASKSPGTNPCNHHDCLYRSGRCCEQQPRSTPRVPEIDPYVVLCSFIEFAQPLVEAAHKLLHFFKYFFFKIFVFWYPAPLPTGLCA